MVFHEITRPAIERAVRESRDLDRRLVDAQEARRILDRLYGYEVSPVLWKKVMPRLSAGRVQSVATRLVVERERARMRFRPAVYWDIDGVFARGKVEELVRRRPGRRRRDPAGHRARTSVRTAPSRPATAVRAASTRAGARGLAERLADSELQVRSVEQRPYRRSPYAPFMTSTLQQEAGRKLRFALGPDHAGGPAPVRERATSPTCAPTRPPCRTRPSRRRARPGPPAYGAEYVPGSPRRYDKKVKNAQEAHEAIRPGGRDVPDARAAPACTATSSASTT